MRDVKAVIVIPARYASTRFPGKPLALIAGQTLIERVYKRAVRSKQATAVVVATDDDRIFEHVRSFGGEVVRTVRDHLSGTDRIAEAIEILGTDVDQVINIQGDEPLIDIEMIDRLIEVLQNETPDVITLCCPLSEEEFRSRDVVKVVTTLGGNALYFSRSAIPHDSWRLAKRHVGVYGYQVEVLRQFTQRSPSPLELEEKLEQLRLLQNGFTIRVLETSKPHLGVDRPEDVMRVEDELAKSS